MINAKQICRGIRVKKNYSEEDSLQKSEKIDRLVRALLFIDARILVRMENN